MRTYSRKKEEYKVIEGVKELCRLCLGKSDEVVPIFTDSSVVCAALPMRIMICVGLEMVREECLPNIICKTCYDELERYYTFRKKCEVTYQKLKAHVRLMKVRAAIMASEAMDTKEDVKENVVSKQDVEVPVQNGDVEEGQLVLMFNQNELQIMDVVNFNGETPNNLTIEENVVQMQDITTTSHPPSIETTTEADMSILLSSILIQLGILSQQGELLEIIDPSFQEMELEVEDGERVTLELVEEDDLSNMPQWQEFEVPPSDDIKLVMETVEPHVPVTVSPVLKPSKKTTKAKIVKDEADKQPVQAPRSVRGAGGGAAGAWCDICGKLYSSRSVLARHRRAHSAERPHVCARCGRAFTQKSVLTRHELVHQVERPFKCASCSKSFTQRGALELHARRHAPPHARSLAIHRCGSCPKVFLYASGLSRHMSVHEGRVFQCAECDRKFRDKSALRRHVRGAGHGRGRT